MKFFRLLLILAVMSVAGCDSTIDFSPENLSYSGTPVVPGNKFYVGDILTENTTQTQIIVLPFQWSSVDQCTLDPFPASNWTTEGYVEVVADGMAGGSYFEFHLNNASLGFARPIDKTVKDIRFNFGDYGGNVNLIVSNLMNNEKDFRDIILLPSLLVELAVTTTLPRGNLRLSGNLPVFQYPFPCELPFVCCGSIFTPPSSPSIPYIIVVGGQELWIDDIIFSLAPI